MTKTIIKLPQLLIRDIREAFAPTALHMRLCTLIDDLRDGKIQSDALIAPNIAAGDVYETPSLLEDRGTIHNIAMFNNIETMQLILKLHFTLTPEENEQAMFQFTSSVPDMEVTIDGLLEYISAETVYV